MEEHRKHVGIMTWYTYRNYGSALQASALYEVIRVLGYQPCMINYPPKGDAVTLRRIGIPYYAKKVKKFLKNRHKKPYTSPGREALFAEYLAKRVTETTVRKTYPELYELNETFDAFVCGSDQIWAPVCYDDKYFLSFVQHHGKKVAYAPSIGLPFIEDPLIRECMAKQIASFTHLSVREMQGAALIKSLTGQTAKVVLDPTLLLNADQWDEFVDIASCNSIEGDYIVCYFLGDASRYTAYVEQLSKETGLPVYTIPVTREDYTFPAVPFEVGPREFVSLIRGAKHVCTDSFHGMAFSINYEIPFTVFKRFSDNDPRNQNTRILSLLDLVGLQNRLVDPNGNLVTATFSFEQAAKQLQDLRESSAMYLLNALREATSEQESSGDYTITDLCCGCGACAAICPTDAITISRDEEGFEHYRIDSDTCVQCGRCKTVCPFGKITAADLHEAQALYAAKSTNKTILKTSSSGGIGYELARFGLENGTYVCGCRYDTSSNTASHVLLSPEDSARLHELQGSKYVQSISADALRAIRALPKGEKLLFLGTPCQAAGVDKLLAALKRRDDAILVDLICHGVPSGFLWENFLREVDKKCQTGSHPAVQFRNKDRSWRKRSLVVRGADNVYCRTEETDDFYAFFRRGLCDMSSCFDCPYRERSAADIRIGDYWGPRFADDTEGVSMVLTCTERGAQFFALAEQANRYTQQEHPLSEYWQVQYPYNHGKPLFRKKLIAELKEGDQPLSTLRKEYCRSYDISEYISKTARKVKALLRRGN